MKCLIKNYVDKLTIDKLKEFALKNDIYLSENEFEYLLDLIKNNFEDILVQENKYLDLVKENVNHEAFIKIRELFLYYKNRYKGYLI